MAISYRLAHILKSIYQTSYEPIRNSACTANVVNNTSFGKFCVIDLTKDTLEVPLFIRGIVEYNLRNDRRNELVVNLHPGRTHYYSSTEPMLKALFNYSYLGEGLAKVTTNKGQTYYGDKGLILDSQYNPLFLVTAIYEKEEIPTSTLGYDITGINIYIHPLVFEETGILHKAIIKSILPFYLREPTYIKINSYGANRKLVTPKYLIENVSPKFFVNPISPSVQTCSNEALNQTLIDHIDDIIALVR